MSGWISLHRQIWNCGLSPDNEPRPYTSFEAWLWLLTNASHKDKRILVDGIFREISQGEFICSVLSLSKAWHWDRRHVEKFLSALEEECMISRHKMTQKCTRLRIARYVDYQAKNNSECATESTTESTQLINKQVNNTSLSKKSSQQPEKFTPDDLALAEELFACVKVLDPKTPQPNFSKWADVFRLLREKDNRTVDEIRQVMTYLQTDVFWRPLVLDPKGLRKQFGKLVAKRNAGLSQGFPSSNQPPEDEDQRHWAEQRRQWFRFPYATAIADGPMEVGHTISTSDYHISENTPTWIVIHKQDASREIDIRLMEPTNMVKTIQPT